MEQKTIVIPVCLVMQIANLPQQKDPVFLKTIERPTHIEVVGFSPDRTNLVLLEAAGDTVEPGQIGLLWGLTTGIHFKDCNGNALKYRLVASEFERHAIQRILEGAAAK